MISTDFSSYIVNNFL